ncbi:hypothetical protein Ais01nite_43590 [Asanoa ishikariensis]|uniref:hypothetical protein n=1 Tax=Asanoa ishikariensis TaxID=137265 RepID=UPI000B87137E|nr:hypothetical protein [Asanoa ishikariensis]GIF66324.1 hypothetical protein Ais01nite_43590 [Asanoa ishikariensis]
MLAILLALLPAAVAVPSTASATPSATSAPARATFADCGVLLTFGKIVECPSVEAGETHVYAVTTTRRDDTLVVTSAYVSGEYVSGEITNSTGHRACSFSSGGTTKCQLGAAGTYTITISSRWGPGAYTLAVDSFKTPSSCTALNNAFFSFGSAGLSATLPKGSPGHCYRFNQPVGSVLQLTRPLGSVAGTIVDGAFAPICQLDNGAAQCMLGTPGPYRLFMTEYSGNEATYRLRMPRLTAPTGCTLLRLSGFGDPGANTNTVKVDGDDFTCHNVRANAAGTALFRIHNGQHLNWALYDQAAQRVCDEYEHSRGCVLPAAGDYTLLMLNTFPELVTYQVAATNLARNAGCAPATGTTWTEPTISVTQPSLVGTHCQLFRGQDGDRILLFGAPTVYNELFKWIVDGTGTRLCVDHDEQAGCLLPATGTYRVISYLGNTSTENPEAPYELQVRRLNDPVGCPTVRPGAYGAAPALAGVRCRILDVPTAGAYLVRARSAENYDSFPSIHDAEFRSVGCGLLTCPFPAAGRYTMILSATPDSIVQNDFAYATTFLPAAPPSCPTAPGNGEPMAGEFRAVGQVDCLALTAPAGAKVASVRPAGATGAGRPYVALVDSTGAFHCDSNYLDQFSCELRGAGPFFALIDNLEVGAATGGYQLGLPTVSPPPSCALLPKDTTGATATSGANRFGFCFTIPADAHAAREDLRYQRTSGGGSGSLSVFSADGIRYCSSPAPSADFTLPCTLPEGPLTVLLETAAQTATWQITRLDPPTT